MQIKSQKLRNILKDTLSIIDCNGKPIDKRIRLLVAILRSLDFETTSSCSGHLIGKTPYVEISSSIALEFENNEEIKNLIELIV